MADDYQQSALPKKKNLTTDEHGSGKLSEMPKLPKIAES
jgi:hypothetical protein